MKLKELHDLPITQIRIVNPRTRSKKRFQLILSSIETVGLKKPITVTKRQPADDGTRYDLVCGQGRLEAFLALGQTTIPANVISATREDQFLMSLVENIARRPPTNKDLFREVKNLVDRGYSAQDIAAKLGSEPDYIDAVIQLIRNDGASLVDAVEGNRLPVSVAVLISSASDPEIQKALSEAYESGELRGARFKEAKRIIARFGIKRSGSPSAASQPRLTGEALVREYQKRTREQQALVKRAALIREKLVLLKSAMKTLLHDDHFVTLLRAENLQDMPDDLAAERV